jgi:dTDP-4-amino-4,6-dideoxygalactose transaminase
MFDIVEEFWTAADLDRAAERSAGESPVADFESRFAEWIGADWAAFVPSGTDGIARILAAHEVGAGDEVVVPSFLCASVAHAVFAVGARPVLVDSSMPGEPLPVAPIIDAFSARTRAFLAPHLYGIPIDLSALADECRTRGVVLLEDRAHTLIPGQGRAPGGDPGDYAVYSFNYDKPISLGGGGMITGRGDSPLGPDAFRGGLPGATPEAARRDVERMRRWLALRRTSESGGAMRIPARSWRRLRMRAAEPSVIRRRRHAFHPDREARGDAFRAALGLLLLARYDDVRRSRNANAERLRDWLTEANAMGVAPSTPAHGALGMLRFPLLLPELAPAAVDQVARRLRSAGFRAGRLNWPVALHQIPDIERRSRTSGSLSGATTLAGHLLNLPIHQNLAQDDLSCLFETLSRALADVSASRSTFRGVR